MTESDYHFRRGFDAARDAYGNLLRKRIDELTGWLRARMADDAAEAAEWRAEIIVLSALHGKLIATPDAVGVDLRAALTEVDAELSREAPDVLHARAVIAAALKKVGG